MKANKNFWLILGIFAFVIWMILISTCVVDLIDSVIVLQNVTSDLQGYMLDIIVYPQVAPYFVPGQDSEDILGIELVSLSDETKEIVEDLRWKHNPFLVYDDSIEVVWQDYWSWHIYFEDGTFYVETQDSTWFIEMQRKEE